MPQVAALLDVAAMRPVLARCLGSGAATPEVQVRYLRYKPGTRLIVRWDVCSGDATHVVSVMTEPATDLAAWATDPRHLSLARAVAARTPATSAIAWEDDLKALIQWFPLDVSMPPLAQETVWLRGELRALGVAIAEDGPAADLLAYKARRRAVLLLDSHVVKIYAGGVEFAGAVSGLEGSARLRGVRVPACEAISPDLKLTCQALLTGDPAEGRTGAAAAGELISRVHAARLDGLQSFPPEAQLQAAASSARSVAALAPELAERLGRLLAALEDQLPSTVRLVPAHGDFHAGQLLDPDAQAALLDFDEMCAAPAALDLSSYLAHLVHGEDGDAPVDEALVELVKGYGGTPPGLSWYVATSILRRCPFPFRFLRDDWPEETARMVTAAEGALVAARTTPPRRAALRRNAPRDDAMPQLGELLDATAMAPVLERSLAGSALDDLRVSYAQYRPGRSLLVAYETTIGGRIHEAVALVQPGADLASSTTNPVHLALARRAASRSPVAMPLSYDERLHALIQWPPLDLRLPALAEPPERMSELLGKAGIAIGPEDGLPELIHYKPRRRAVFRFGGHFVKVYADGDAFERAVAGLRNASRLRIRKASCTAILPELRLQAQSLVAGSEPDSPAFAARAAGSLLAVIHAAEVEAPRQAPTSWRLRQAESHARTISALVPHLAGRIEALVRELERTQPEDTLVPCHGDFFSRQMLGLDGDYAVIDFDSTCMSPPALDIATYASSIVGGDDDLPAARELADEVAGGYGRRPPGIAWFLCAVLLRRSTIPFRRQVDDWPAAIEKRVDAAAYALGR